LAIIDITIIGFQCGLDGGWWVEEGATKKMVCVLGKPSENLRGEEKGY